MSALTYPQLSDLTQRWRVRAKAFMEEAADSTLHADVVRLTSMASTLEWAALDLSVYIQAEPSASDPQSASGLHVFAKLRPPPE